MASRGKRKYVRGEEDGPPGNVIYFVKLAVACPAICCAAQPLTKVPTSSFTPDDRPRNYLNTAQSVLYPRYCRYLHPRTT